MRFGKRSLAGLASGALLLSGIAIVAAQPAQAAPTTSVYCSNAGGGGSAGTIPDVTTVKPNCVLPVAAGFPVTFAATNFMGSSVQWVSLTITGDSTFQAKSTWAGTGTTLSADGKTIYIQNNSTAFGDADMSLGTTGVRTVTVALSSTSGSVPPAQATFSDGGTLTVTGSGNAARAVVSQGYYVVDDSTVTTTPAGLALVHILDASGIPLNIASATKGAITQSAAGGTLALTNYLGGDCTTSGTFNTTVSATLDPGELAQAKIGVPACELTAAAGITAVPNSGVWLTYTPASATQPGNYTASFSLTLSGNTYPVTVNYTVSDQLAVTSTGLSFDKAEYLPGGLITASFGLKDINGLPTPDGIWGATANTRAWDTSSSTNAPIFLPTTGAAIAPTVPWSATTSPASNVVTYNGVATAEFLAPPNAMAAFAMKMVAGNTVGTGWASTLDGESWTAVAKIGNPEPVKPTILIEGTRGKGESANMVFVEGTTTELAGKTVTPYFRFPGQTGFTAGTGLRTVDAQGNFAWERKTGKQIAVQFRAGDVKSNTVLIEAK